MFFVDFLVNSKPIFMKFSKDYVWVPAKYLKISFKNIV